MLYNKMAVEEIITTTPPNELYKYLKDTKVLEGLLQHLDNETLRKACRLRGIDKVKEALENNIDEILIEKAWSPYKEERHSLLCAFISGSQKFLTPRQRDRLDWIIELIQATDYRY